MLVDHTPPGQHWAAAQRLELTAKNGMRLEGEMVSISSLAQNLLAPEPPKGGVDVRLILVIDDGLRRTFLSQYQVREGSVREPETRRAERIEIPQPVARTGPPIGSVTAIVGVQPFDPWGRRTYSLLTARGQLDVVQGITEITPLWTKVEGLSGARWDMRIATSSIPRDVLSQIIRHHVDTHSAEGRLSVVRLLFEAERYADARHELEQAMHDFPQLGELELLLTQLRQLVAQRLIQEIQLRQQAGQYERAAGLLHHFPTTGIAGETLQRAAELVAQDQSLLQRIESTRQLIKQLVGQLPDPAHRDEVEPLVAEIDRDLNRSNLDRLADFLRLGDDQTLTVDQRIGLAVSGWLMGSGAGITNLPVAIDLARVRDRVVAYLASTDAAQRKTLLEELSGLEGSSPDQVAKIIAHLVPPLPADPPIGGVAGYHRFPIARLKEEEKAWYYVQLPDEYDPYRRYPAIVTLHAAGTTPAQQIDWWAGAFDSERQMRTGQAARHGYLVIAPEWLKKGQTRYGYSAEEHAVVLAALRDACRRFSIDTDRVFLTGHSQGGDAAWDIGLAHPDLWAGVIPIVAVADYGKDAPKYISHYSDNARYVPMYFVCGELDADKMTSNARDFDHYLTHTGTHTGYDVGYDVMIVEYRGRGHEHFYDEIHRLFEWMQLHRRDFYRRSFQCVTLRPWDSFFWCLELADLPDSTIMAPVAWSFKSGARAAQNEFRVGATGSQVYLKTPARTIILWLAPGWLDLHDRITIQMGSRRRTYDMTPSLEVMLEDVRTRSDRLHPFWTKVDLSVGR